MVEKSARFIIGNPIGSIVGGIVVRSIGKNVFGAKQGFPRFASTVLGVIIGACVERKMLKGK